MTSQVTPVDILTKTPCRGDTLGMANSLTEFCKTLYIRITAWRLRRRAVVRAAGPAVVEPIDAMVIRHLRRRGGR